MSKSIPRAWVLASGLVVALVGCTTPPPAQADGPPRSATSGQADEDETGAPLFCTAIGNAEGISVDLADVLDLEGGDYFAEVSVPAQGASNIRGFAGNDEYYPGSDVGVDLDRGPVTVDVVVRTEDGQPVYTATATATPNLYQPNGAACDGENYFLSLLATNAGELTPLPWPPRSPRLDARGRESIALYTVCGVGQLDLDGASYVRDGGVLGGPDDPPAGWNTPFQRGWVTRDGQQASYTDDAGHHETFTLEPDSTPQPFCG